MEFKSRYVSKQPNEQGYVDYTDEENEIWHDLYVRQQEIIVNRACQEHILGIDRLGLDKDTIPQLPDVNQRLQALTGWTVYPVGALISHEKFFNLLANKQFPAATFIRKREELDYLQEPDIFHEIYGHCPMLTDLELANFVQRFAKKVLSMPESDWPLMQRLFWFTVEFGLIDTKDGLRAYGGGILSSIGETVYSVESDIPQRQLFNPLVVFRTPYRIDAMQKVYFVIKSYQQLYECMSNDIDVSIQKARELGEFPALFEIEADNPSIHIYSC